MGNSRKKLGNKLILFEIAMTNNEMMSSGLSNILEWPGRKFVHTCTLRDTILSNWLNQQKIVVVRPIAD